MRIAKGLLMFPKKCVVLNLLLVSCATQPIAGPTGVYGERACGGPSLDCRGYFSQAAQEFKVNISGLYGPTSGGLGFGVGSTQLMALDSITGDMIIHFQRYCVQYNACMISQEEFLRKTDTLQAAQSEIRRLVGTLNTPPAQAGAPWAGTTDTNVALSGSIGPSDGMTREMRVADAVFKVALEAMRASASVRVNVGSQQVTSSPVPTSGRVPVVPSVPTTPPPGGSGAQTEDSFRTVVQELTQITLTQSSVPKPLKIVLGEVSYRDTEFGSPLSVFLKSRLEEQLRGSGTFVVVATPRLGGAAGAETAKLSAALAEAAGADAVITGNYWDSWDGVEVFVSLRQRQGNVLLGVARTWLPAGLLPPDTQVTPANLQNALLNERIEDRVAPLSVAQAANPLRVEVWVDRGKGAIYADGEEVLVMVRVSQDAYLRLFYTDANNQTYQVFPNIYRQHGWVPGGQVVTIPALEDRFVFKVMAPFGIESLTALASRTPFGGPAPSGTAEGPFMKISQGLRGLEVIASSAKPGEIVRDRAVLTTVRTLP